MIKTIIVWLLVSVSDSSYNSGNLTVVDRFAAANDCEWVRQHLPLRKYTIETVCIQARIIQPETRK